MRLAQMTWPQVERYFRKNDMVMMGIGSIECHGRHMPLGTDLLIPEKLLEMVEVESEIMIAPSIPYGACDYLSDFPGTISLGSELLYRVLSKTMEHLYNHGMRKFLIVNGHGGNISAIKQIGFDLRRKDGLLAELDWWKMAGEINPAWKGGHGGAEETSAILGINSSWVDKSQIGAANEICEVSGKIQTTGFSTARFKGIEIGLPRLAVNITDNGWLGPDHPDGATEEWGLEMLRSVSDYIVEFIDEFQKADWKKSSNGQL